MTQPRGHHARQQGQWSRNRSERSDLIPQSIHGSPSRDKLLEFRTRAVYPEKWQVRKAICRRRGVPRVPISAFEVVTIAKPVQSGQDHIHMQTRIAYSPFQIRTNLSLGSPSEDRRD